MSTSEDGWEVDESGGYRHDSGVTARKGWTDADQWVGYPPVSCGALPARFSALADAKRYALEGGHTDRDTRRGAASAARLGRYLD